MRAISLAAATLLACGSADAGSMESVFAPHVGKPAQVVEKSAQRAQLLEATITDVGSDYICLEIRRPPIVPGGTSLTSDLCYPFHTIIRFKPAKGGDPPWILLP